MAATPSRRPAHAHSFDRRPRHFESIGMGVVANWRHLAADADIPCSRHVGTGRTVIFSTRPARTWTRDWTMRLLSPGPGKGTS